MIARAVLPTRRSRTWVFLWIALFLMGILLQYGVALSLPSSTKAASGLLAGTVQSFEVEGDLYSGNASSNPADTPDGDPAGEDDFVEGTLTDADDWLDGGPGVGVVDPETAASALINDPTNSQGDDIFIGGAKEDDTCTWGYTTGKPTGKDDFDHVMAYAKFVSGNAYFFAGAERLHTQGGGDTTIDFELNRNPFRSFGGGPVVADRSIGDLLISLEFANGGGEPEVRIFQVTGVDPCNGGEKATFTEKSNAQVQNAVNSATNFVDIDGFSNGQDPISPFDFSEVSVNLHALGIDPSCPGFASGHVRSRAGGDIDSSQLKDNAEPFPIDLNTCGKLRIIKEDPQGNLLGGSEYSITPDPRPGRDPDQVVIKDNDETDNAAQAGDQDGTAGQLEIDPAKPDSYTVCETKAPPGYKLPADPCQTKTLGNNDTVRYVFVDPPKVAATTLTPRPASPLDGSFVAVGDTINLRVRETNTGESILTNVHVTGEDSCDDWTPQANKNAPDAGEAFNGTLNPGESVDFTCSFAAPADNDFTWSALGHGTDEKGDPAPSANEDESGSYDVLMPATTLTVKTPPPAAVHAGDPITIVVTEKNSGEGTISAVTVTGINSCALWTAAGFDGDLAPNESVDFSCSFNAPANDFAWSADGHGTDALNHPVPAAGEHVEGTVDIVKPATELTLVGTVPATVHAGDSVTITVNEKNTGDGPLHGVSVVSEGGICSTWTPAGGFSGTLAAGASVNFSCTFTAPADGTDVHWSALGTGLDSLDAAAPDANERRSGDIEVIRPATALSIKTNAPAKVHAGDAVTIVVTEANTGDDALSGVHVDGGGACATWTAAANKNGGGSSSAPSALASRSTSPARSTPRPTAPT